MKNKIAVKLAALAMFAAVSANAATWYWTGDGGDLNWFTPANWNSAADGSGDAPTEEAPLASGDSFTFDAVTPSGDVNYNPEGNFNITTITFGAGLTGTVKITGGKITSLGNAVNNNATYSMEFANEIQFASTINLTVPTKHILLSGGARGTLPANHNKLYGKYTLTSGWTVTANYTIASGSHVTVPSISQPQSYQYKISTEANSLLVVNGNFTTDHKVSGKAAYGLGTHNGELRVFGTFKVRNQVDNGLYFVGSGSGVILARTMIHQMPGAANYTHTGQGISKYVLGSGGYPACTGVFREYVRDWHAFENFTYVGNNNGNGNTGKGLGSDYYKKDLAFHTTDYLDGVTPRTITIYQSRGMWGTIPHYLKAYGCGTLRYINNWPYFTKGLVAYDSVTILMTGAYRPSAGPLDMRGTSKFVIANASAGTIGIGAAITFAGGTSLVVSNLTSLSSAPLTGTTLALGNASTTTVRVDRASGALPNGLYPIVTLTSGTIPATFSNLVLEGTGIEGKRAQLMRSTDSKTLLVAVDDVPSQNTCIWTGEGEDDNFSTPENWQDGMIPNQGGEEIVFPVAGTANNDLESCSPASILFPVGLNGVITIGGNAFTNVGEVKNLSQYTPVVNAPVEFAGEIKVTQPAIASGSAVSGATVRFAGGAYGDNIATNKLMFFSGRYTMRNTPETTWSAGFDTNDARQHVMPGSSLSVDHVYRTHSLNILSGGAVTANVVNVAVAANGQRVWAWNAGEYVVTGAVVATGIANSFEMTTGWANNSVGKFEKITIDGSAAGKFFNFGNASTAASHTFYIGDGGLNFNTPETLASYSSGYSLDGDVVTFKPWHGSFAIGQAGDAGKFRIRAATVFDTDNEAGEGKTITVNCGTVQNNAEGKSITVKGSGTVRFNGAAEISVVKPLVLQGTATLEIGADANTSTGTLTLGDGTTLSMPDGVVALKNSQVATPASGTATLYIGGAAPQEGDYEIFNSATGLLAADWTNHLALAFENAPALPARLYSPDGAKIRLLVGDTSNMPAFVWTGDAGDGKMSTPGNWLYDAVPQGDATIIFPAASGEIVNDLDSFSPKSITFGYGISAGIKISGNPITGLYAITNLAASINPEIASRVTFAEGVEADILAACGANYLKFTGGMTAYTFKKRGASGDAGNIHIAGLITITKNHSDWGGYKEIDHFFLRESGTVLNIPNSVVQKTSPANFSIEAGAKVCITGDLVSKTTGFAHENNGTLDVSGWVVKDSTSNVHFSSNPSSGYIKAYGIKEATSGQGGSFVLTSTDNKSYEPHWVLGAGGMASGADFITHDAASGEGELKTHIYASDDFVINGSIKLGYQTVSASRWPMLHIHTEDLDETPHTITMQAGFVNGNTVHPCMRVYGHGTFVDKVGELLPSGVEVFGPATYSLMSSNPAGNSFALKSGATFKVPSSGNVTLKAANILENTTLAFNFTDGSTPPCIVFSGTPTIASNITVAVTTDVSLPFNTPKTLTSGAGIADADLSKFTLDEETAKWATLTVSGGNLVLTRKQFFHIRIADSEAVDIPWNWVEENVGKLESDAVDFTSAVLADGANGIPVWQSYCMGLEPTNSQSVVLCEAAADQPSEAGKVAIEVSRSFVPAELSGVTVKAYLDVKRPGHDWDFDETGETVSSGAISRTAEISDPGISFFA